MDMRNDKRYSSLEVPASRGSRIGNMHQRQQNPISVYDQQRFQEEKMLIEQDPFMLEEQRYLSRLQKANDSCQQKYKHHYEKFTAPEVSKKKELDMAENYKIEQRMKSLA